MPWTDFGLELFVLDLLVAFESHAADDRVLDDHDDQTAASLIDLHVLEQAGLDQGLQAVVDPRAVEASAGAGLEIGTDGIGFDAAVAFHTDGSRGLSNSLRRYERGGRHSGNRQSKHHQGGGQTAP